MTPLVPRRCPKCNHLMVSMDPLPDKDGKVVAWRLECPNCRHVWVIDAPR